MKETLIKLIIKMTTIITITFKEDIDVCKDQCILAIIMFMKVEKIMSVL